MELIDVIRDKKDVCKILAADRPDLCKLGCHEKFEHAHSNMRSLADWWLDPLQRSSVGTQIRVLRGGKDDEDRSDAICEIIASTGMEIPVFLMITQHSLRDRIKHLHYQLQISCMGELVKKAKTVGLERAASREGENARKKIEKLKSAKQANLESISLEEPFERQRSPRFKKRSLI